MTNNSTHVTKNAQMYIYVYIYIYMLIQINKNDWQFNKSVGKQYGTAIPEKNTNN